MDAGAVSYAGAPVEVRRDLEAAHARAWRRLAAPGTWWTGAERVAIAAETRRARECRLCRQRKAALSPGAVTGSHDHGGALPADVVEAVHRIASDPAQLSRRWFEALDVADTHYVEAVGVAVRTVAIDSFCRGIGTAPHPLPDPEPGAPSRRRPATATAGEAWVPMIAASAATGLEADLYGGNRRAPNVARALSLVPEEVRGISDLGVAQYVPFERVPDPSYEPGRGLSRAQIELVAARVSALNECFY